MVKMFISGLISVFLCGIVGASVSVAIAALLSYAASHFLVCEAVEKIKDKQMPNWIEWTAYGTALVGTILLAAGFRYSSVGVLIAAGVVYLISIIAFKVNGYIEENR